MRLALFILLITAAVARAQSTQPATTRPTDFSVGYGNGVGGKIRSPHAPPTPGQVVDMDIKSLGNFDYDVHGAGRIPPDVLRLDGIPFRTRGFMRPLDEAVNVTEFALVPSLFNCCFGQPPQMHHTILVHGPPGKAFSYAADQVVVQGTLHVRETREDGYVTSIFEIDAVSVKPLAH